MIEANDALQRLEEAAQKQAAEERAAQAISIARCRLVLGKDAKSAFFATLALRLIPEVRWDVETLATDGKQLVYNPEFINRCSPEEQIGLVAHEVMHLSLGHHARRGHRDMAQWNVAADLAINPLLIEAGFTLPSDGCVPGKGQYAKLPVGKSAEDYYNLLPNTTDGDCRNEAQNHNPCPDPGGCGGVLDPGDGSPAACKEAEGDAAVAVSQAERVAKQRGELPGGIARLVAQVLEPKVDWRETLRAFVSRFARNDYSWAHPNRRIIHQGLYLPGLRSEELGDVVLAIDTSGSIGGKVLERFASEAEGILQSYDCTVTILYHDAHIQHVQSWRSTDGPLVLEPKGGGGTDHHAVFDWIAEQDVDPACLVCLTDLASSFPDGPPTYPVLWATVDAGNLKAPFGMQVEID
jgi:predicted metal-dependent peptidase